MDLRQAAADAANERSELAEKFWRALEAYQERNYTDFDKLSLEAYQSADKKYKEIRDKLMAQQQKP